MLLIKASLGLSALLSTLAVDASPIGGGSIDPSKPFALQYIARNASQQNPDKPFNGTQQSSDTLAMFEPDRGIPLGAQRWLEPSNHSLSSTPFTIQNGHLNVAASAVPVPMGVAAWGWTSNDTSSDGPIIFVNRNASADAPGKLRVDTKNSAIAYDGTDFTKFWLCYSNSVGSVEGQYLSLGQDTASSAPCTPLFLYAVKA